ncbi:short-chain dehydrogenase, partial [Cylindrobasidium torrendii FP15055 ss-10]
MSTPVVIVTGASKGIGLAVVRALLSRDARVATVSRTRTDELQHLVANNGVLAIECDVTDEAALNQAVERTKGTFGRIDGLVLNAGALEPLARISDTTHTLEEWKYNFNVNFFSLVTAVQAALPDLRQAPGTGKVVFVSSGAAVKGTPGWGAYNASKAATNSLCRTLAEEENNIIAVALRPGVVDTAMQATIRQDGSQAMGSGHDTFVKLHADGKLLKPDAPGEVIARLALHAPASLSGKFVSWDGEECKAFRSS